MSTWGRDFEFDSFRRRYVISRRPAADALSSHRAAELVRYQVRFETFLRSKLARWARNGSRAWTSGDDDHIVRELVRNIESGMFRVYEVPIAGRVDPHRVPNSPQRPESPQAPEPTGGKNEIVDEARSLFITRCDPTLTIEGPLRFSYLIHGLAGRPATLRIRSSSFPGGVVHERSVAPAETTDGVHDDTWDGRVLHPGEQQPRRLSAEYSPCVLEIEHDQLFRDEAAFTIAEPDYKVEFADLHFATGREVLLPLPEDLDPEQGAPRAAPLHVIASLLEFAADHPERKIVVYGHADTAGGSSPNEALSDQRARNIHLYLAGDSDGWAAHAQQHYEVADFKRVHVWAASRSGWATDPGPIDNEWTNQARKARNEFRSRCSELFGVELKQGVKQNEEDWKAIFSLYDLAVAERLACSTEDLGALRGRLSFADPACIGCGEHWPVVGQGQDGLTERLNRRVEVVFYEPDELPKTHGSEQPPGDEVYGGGRYRLVRISADASDEALLRIRLLDGLGEHMPGAKYTARTRNQPWTGTADGEGVATVPRALVDNEFLLSWSPADLPEVTHWRVHVLETADGKTEAGVRQRLFNLGFEFGNDTKRAVAMFQRALDLPPTGVLADVVDLVNEWYETGVRPTPDPDEYEWSDAEPSQPGPSKRDNDW